MGDGGTAVAAERLAQQQPVVTTLQIPVVRIARSGDECIGAIAESRVQFGAQRAPDQGDVEFGLGLQLHAIDLDGRAWGRPVRGCDREDERVRGGGWGHRCIMQLPCGNREDVRSEEHTSELQSLMRISYAVLRLKKK